MPKFETPEPISVNLEFAAGSVRIVASDRTDTVVEVRPANPAEESDVKAAEQIRVDFTGGTLQLIGPKRVFDFSRKTRAVEVSIELPTGSQIAAHLQWGEFRCVGRLGECRIKSTGNVVLERTGPLHLHTGHGHITVDGVAGDAEISTASGKIRVGEIAGGAEVKNSNGDTRIDAVGGDVRVRNANGDIAIEHAGAGVDAKTSNGGIRLGEVVRGSVVLGVAAGDLDIGIAAGTAAWLEVSTGFGQVRNELTDALGPDEADRTVEVRGRTAYGDITIRRARSEGQS
ncbi:DUF4097 family beta strand repeat-containing protein [Paractinoplanes durhamensis]|uniref:DUF4097 domain-containing protein n=1 Tax=Paractinoplanes durhamensis TaxID=113563 RepID=A0ABQ3YUY9_9ACTN|nr:DUF4097 family beta strand repeat-containing protein [Actinoplanes durhamensis]GIE01345.1 hypothetical protein Adu01nite_26950 [Actinoplanes durhamensis]